MRLPKYALPVSVIGTLAGSTLLLNLEKNNFPLGKWDYSSGGRYNGEERIAGKTVIVTGANTGIGKETARELARRGGRIIMACRDLDKCEIARKEIVLETANKSVECRKLDLASFASIRAFAKLINSTESHVDILINNAGVMMCPKMLTEDGLEMQMGVNHFGHFLLTQLLLDKLKASAPSRIIFLSSLAHTRGQINFEDLNSAQEYNSRTVYGQSKLANVLCTQELAKILEGTNVTVNCLHPGVVNTELSRHLGFTQSKIGSFVFFPIKFLLLKTPLQGAQTTLRLALDPSLEKVTGKYFSDCREKEPAPQGQDAAAAKRLWAVSEAWTRVKQD
ncbi:retinol dehydrogenase 13 isoform X2 [Aplysia californica]|uniref:Retinol dehydrogenase 13 isoform X2 n=1 Tax=Aplysia californica TaxID=6500 RepID=A0ABM1W0T1_APLCA|nr:retinol dehydrogenase 13 isoform X2 [Aplysia californica]